MRILFFHFLVVEIFIKVVASSEYFQNFYKEKLDDERCENQLWSFKFGLIGADEWGFRRKFI